MHYLPESQIETASQEEFQQFLRYIEQNIDLFTEEQIIELQKSLRQIEQMEEIEKAKTDFLTFVKVCGPSYLRFSSKGQHHKLARFAERLIDGDLKRVTVSMPPRFGKSEFFSICLPAWTIGKHPDWKIIQASANDMIATDFGRKVKGIIESPMFRRVFPNVTLSKDSKAAGKFATNHGGTYFAVGITSGVAGLGADVFICDDIVNEQTAKSGDAAAFESAWAWFQSGPLQRLQPGGRIVIIGTRWSKADPIGKVKRRMQEDKKAERYESIEFSALDEHSESNFPEIWSTDELQNKKNNMAPHLWTAQYEQSPTSASGSIVAKSFWKRWDRFRRIPGTIDEVEFIPPECFLIIMAIDTAETANKRSNPTACVIFGVFSYKDPATGQSENNLILLHSIQKKMEFHALKQTAKLWVSEWRPDRIIVEAKSTGPALRSELREAGINTQAVRPKPNEDKAARLASTSDVFASGRVWYMPTIDNEVTINQVADFPQGDGDDLVDVVAYAVRDFRSGGLVTTNNDVPHETQESLVDREYY